MSRLAEIRNTIEEITAGPQEYAPERSFEPLVPGF